MVSRLSDDDLPQLTPLLGSLARLIASGSALDDVELRTLLLGTDVEPCPAVLRELGRWKELLIALRKNPALRMVTVEALQSRGLPEAPVLLAVDAVIGDLEEEEIIQPSDTSRLIASVEQLDLGTLSPGQGATAEFEVQGGPGRIVVESDQLEVMPLEFGAEPTTIRVKVKPLTSGVLWTNIRLITPGETLKVPVLAQWPAELPQEQENNEPPRKEVVVSNLVHGLEEAIRQAQTGEVIRLQGGEYRLNRSLKIHKGLSLLGEGMEVTQVVFAGEGCVLEYAGEGVFSARGIAFIHEGEKWGDAVLASSGEVSFYDCRFTGGVRDSASQRGGSGLLLCGTVRGRVEGCQAIRNQLMGIKVSGQAQPLLRGNVCQGNNHSGIAYFGSAGGAAQQNTCKSNEKHGIYVTEQARPTIESNICRDNKGDGISYRETAGGVVRNNECIDNGEDGIYVPPAARPMLHNNRCRGNKRDVCDMRR